MAFTYVPGTADDRTDVREMIGDTDTLDQLLQDATIDRVLTQQPVKTLAASACCYFIAARFGRRVSKAVGTAKIELQQQFDHFMTLAKELKAAGPGNLPGATPTIVGAISGLSKSARLDILDDEDFRPPGIQSHQDDMPGNVRHNHDDDENRW